MNLQKILILRLRFVMAFIFLWAFVDKLFGLGFSTALDKAWLNGGSPTYGFLAMATKGPFAGFFKSLAGLPLVDWSFMIGLLFIGLTLLFNKYIKWGAIAGVIMMILMWLAVFPPVNNPIIDEHIVYALIFILLAIPNKEGELNLKN